VRLYNQSGVNQPGYSIDQDGDIKGEDLMDHTHMSEQKHAQVNDHNMEMKPEHHYRTLLIMAVLSFIAMYILMYAMVNVIGNVFNNINQVYMAGLMTAPMVVFEVILMSKMYTNKRLNALIIAGSLVLGLLFFLAIRQQAAINDQQFLRSMIPHHAGAILMCEHASISDPEIKQLCQTIISSQQAEIDQMKTILQKPEQ
jgi:uncharacterized protein (DUF305 family)